MWAIFYIRFPFWYLWTIRGHPSPPIGEGIRNTQPISRGLRKFWPETWKFALKIVKFKQNFKISSPAAPMTIGGHPPPPNWGGDMQYAANQPRVTQKFSQTGKFALKIVKFKQNFFACGAYRHRRRYIIRLFKCFFTFSCLHSSFNAPEGYAKISAARIAFAFTILHIKKSIHRIFIRKLFCVSPPFAWKNFVLKWYAKFFAYSILSSKKFGFSDTQNCEILNFYFCFKICKKLTKFATFF